MGFQFSYSKNIAKFEAVISSSINNLFLKSDTVTHGWSSCYIWFLFIFCRWKNCFIHFKLLFFLGWDLLFDEKLELCALSRGQKKNPYAWFLKKQYKLVQIYSFNKTDRVAQWIRHQTSNLGIAGSSPAVVEDHFMWFFSTYDINYTFGTQNISKNYFFWTQTSRYLPSTTYLQSMYYVKL